MENEINYPNEDMQKALDISMALALIRSLHMEGQISEKTFAAVTKDAEKMLAENKMSC